MDDHPKRFKVALSFPGERRDFVEEVANHLSRELGRKRVLYDRYHEAEFARPNLGMYLPDLYHRQSELVAVFLCAEFDEKEWCGLEIRAIVDRIKRKQFAAVMPLRFDEAEIPGFYSIDGAAWIGDRSPEQVARLILERLAINAGGSPPSFEAGSTPKKPIHLPYRSLGDLFRGRDEDVGALHETLGRTGDTRATAIVGTANALHGLGGVGKTRLAVEYAWRHLDDHSAVLFVPADSPESLRRNLAALAGPLVLDLPEHQATEEETQVVAVLRWLRDHPGWLLILDNVDTVTAAGAVEELLNQLAGGQVLITSRLSTWGPGVEARELDVLSPDEATEFLLARTDPRRRKNKEDERDARTLAQELDGLALALEQAGAYIVHHRLTFAGYLGAWRERHDRVLEWHDPRIMSYPASVAATWQTSVEQLGDPARRLLERLAWLAPDPIPEWLLDVPAPGDEDSDKREALAELEAYSLVTRAIADPEFTVHRLVQDVTRRRMEDEAPPRSLLEALGWIDAAFVGDPEDVRNWPTLDSLVLHAHKVSWYADEAAIPEPTAGLMTHIGRLLMKKARHAEAEPLMRRVLEIDEDTFGPDHPQVARDLNNLAQLLQDTNRLDEAEPLMRRTLLVAERYLDRDDPRIATSLNNLALLLQETDRHGEAEPLLRRALQIDENRFGPEHPIISIRLNNLAILLSETERTEEAEPLMRRALRIDENHFGGRHPNVAIRLSNLAQLLRLTNRTEEVEPLMRRALQIDQDSFGPEHPTVAVRLNNLAMWLQATDRLEEAEPLMRRHVEIFLDFTHRTGYEHPHLQAAFRNYTTLLEAMGKTHSEIEETLQTLRADHADHEA